MNLTTAQEIEIYDAYGRKINGHKAIVDKNDQSVIFNIASSNYKIAQHQEVYDATLTALAGTGVKYTPIRTTDQGRRMFAEFDLPTIKHDVKRVGDIINLRVGVHNSYDSSSGVRVEVYGHRLVCSNGLFVSDSFGRYYTRHIHGIDLDLIEKAVVTGIAAFKDKFCHMMEQYAETPVTETKVIEFIDYCTENKVIPIKYMDSIRQNVTVRTGVDKMPVTNKWMLYNAVTEILTHETDNIFVQRQKIQKMDRVMSEFKFAA